MSTSFNITSITPSAGSTPGKITISGGTAGLFAGAFYMNANGSTLPAYTTPIPAEYTLIAATTFEVSENQQFAGKYTVYTRVSASDMNQSAVISGGNTTITVNEIIPTSTSTQLLSTGKVGTISTYLIRVAGESPLVVPPGTTNTSRPLQIAGKNALAWGEQFNQNMVNLAQNFASAAAPSNPYPGQLWYSLLNGSALGGSLNVWDSTKWVPVMNAADVNDNYRASISTPSTTWTIDHNLALQAPYVAMVNAFIALPNGAYTQIVPNSITYVSANRIVLTFTSPYAGHVLIRR